MGGGSAASGARRVLIRDAPDAFILDVKLVTELYVISDAFVG